MKHCHGAYVTVSAVRTAARTHTYSLTYLRALSVSSVLCVDVTSQINAPLERLRAPDARERPESGVLAAVSDEVRRLAERLAALTTHVRLLTCTGKLPPSKTNHSRVIKTAGDIIL